MGCVADFYQIILTHVSILLHVSDFTIITVFFYGFLDCKGMPVKKWRVKAGSINRVFYRSVWLVPAVANAQCHPAKHSQ